MTARAPETVGPDVPALARKPAGRTPVQRAKMAAVFGSARARWLLLRERLGDRGLVRMRYAGRSLYLRLNSTDPLVWFSVFHQLDYGASLPFAPCSIVDAGAYTGLSAVYLANRYPQARIIAVEPDPENFRLLIRNTRAYPAITALHAALWSDSGGVSLHARSEGHWASSLIPGEDGGDNALRVPSVDMPTLMQRFGLAQVDLLKLDVEGAEKEVLKGSAPWIQRVRAIFVELHDRLQPGCSEALAAATPNFDRAEVAPMTTLLIRRGVADPAP